MARTFRTGWAAADITPEEPVLIAGQFHARVSEGIQNRITATALAIEYSENDQPENAILISCDLVTISDSLRNAVREKICAMVPELTPTQILLNATHTHTAPEVRQEIDVISMGGGNVPPIFTIELPAMNQADYIAWAVEQIAAAAKTAWETRAPSGIGYGLGQAVVGHNRRICYQNGECRMYGSTNDPAFSHVEGDADHGVNVLAIWNEARELTGLVVNVACPAQDTEHLFEISADYWHETRVELRRRFGDNLFILPQCSAAGDQSPHVLLNKAAEERMLRLQERTNREEIAIRIADGVSAILPAIEKEIDWTPQFAHACECTEISRRNLTEEDVRDALDEAARVRKDYEAALADLEAHPERKDEPRWYTGITSAYRRMRWNEGVEHRFKLQQTQPKIALELHLFRLGDVAIATDPFEYYLDFGQRIKARSPAVQTFVVQLAGSGTYLPTVRATEGKSYGAVAASTPAGPEGGQEIVETSLTRLTSFWQ